MSPVSFNNVTRTIFGDLKQSWRERGLGTAVGARNGALDKITHTMFADDTTLIASSRAGLATMIAETKAAMTKHEMSLNLGKCFVQNNKGMTMA